MARTRNKQLRLLLGLMRPRKEESAAAPVLKAVLVRAGVQVQPRLHGPRQSRNAQLRNVMIATPAGSLDIRTGHLCRDPPDLSTLVNVVLLVLRNRIYALISWTLTRLGARCVARHWPERCVIVRQPAELEENQDVCVEGGPHLSLRAVPPLLFDQTPVLQRVLYGTRSAGLSLRSSPMLSGSRGLSRSLMLSSSLM